MAKTVRVSRAHNTTRDEALQKLRGLTGDVASRYGVRISDTASGAAVSGRGVNGDCRIDDRNVTIDLSLGLVVRALSGRIEAGINRALDQHFG